VLFRSLLERIAPFRASLLAWAGTPSRLSATAKSRLVAHAAAAPAPGSSRARPPGGCCLSHHELLTLVEPFVRRGIRPDLAATDRMAGRIAFVPRDRAGAAGRRLRETLRLERIGTAGWRLLRDVVRDDGLQASLQTDGRDPATMLARVEAIDPDVHFDDRDGYALTLSHRLAYEPGASDVPIPTRLEAHLEGLVLTTTAPTASGVSGRIDLSPSPGSRPPCLPDDVLAVLGWDWSFLERDTRGWHASVRLRGRGRDRALHAVRRLHEAAGHLSRILRDAPCRFHERLRGERWRASLRRSVPAMVWVALIGEAALAPVMREALTGAVPLYAVATPPVVLLFFFCRSQEPRFAWPRLPQPLDAPAWRVDP
jgi:hypothetical protein